MENHFHFTMTVYESVSGGVVGVIPELPGVVSEGDTHEELKENILDAIKTMLHSNAEDNTSTEVLNGNPRNEKLLVC